MNRTAPFTATCTGRLDVPGAHLHYGLRGSGPLVALVGAPMNADAFSPLAAALASDHSVLTADPRGIGRSRVDDPDADSTPERRADDLARLIRHVGIGPAAVFGSSGGAVSALALAQAHPEQVHTVIAHEPPLTELLEDRDDLLAGAEAYCAKHLAGDVAGAWQAFFAQANIDLPVEVIEQSFGADRDPQTLADERFWFAHELRPSTSWRPDVHALRAGLVRIVVVKGEQSAGQICDRTSQALARALGSSPKVFPGDHTGFVEDPQGAAAHIRAVLQHGHSPVSA